jgi:hypothetical protein
MAERRRWVGNRRKKGGIGEGVWWNRKRRWREMGRDRVKEKDGERQNRQKMMTKRRRGS